MGTVNWKRVDDSRKGQTCIPYIEIKTMDDM